MFDFVEPRVRRVVAEQLGVNTEELTPDVSLTDDLAADSLDLLELTLALEAEFGIVVSESALERVRTYGDLRATVHALLPQRHAAGVRAGVTPLEGWARGVSSRGRAGAFPAGAPPSRASCGWWSRTAPRRSCRRRAAGSRVSWSRAWMRLPWPRSTPTRTRVACTPAARPRSWWMASASRATCT